MVLAECHFLSDILVPFPDLSNLYSQELGPKKQFLEVLSVFFRTTGLQQTCFIENQQQKKESRCGLRGKIWAKLGPNIV